MDDVRCAAARRDNFGEIRFDTARAWRFVIALLEMDDDDDDSSGPNEVLRELGNCPGCLAGFGQTLGSLLTGVLIRRHGRDKVLAVAQRNLDQVLNTPDLLNPGPFQDQP